MNHIPRTALKDISIRMAEGYDLGLALFRVSNHYALDRQQLRQAYERKIKQEEFFSDLLLALGGCPTLVIPDGIRTRERVEIDGGPLNGIAWGAEDWDRAAVTLPAAREGLERLIRESDEQVRVFADVCRMHWREPEQVIAA